jgi:hypothetical protein
LRPDRPPVRSTRESAASYRMAVPIPGTRKGRAVRARIRSGLIATCVAVLLAGCSSTISHPRATATAAPSPSPQPTQSVSSVATETPWPYVCPPQQAPSSNSIENLTMLSAQSGWAQQVVTGSVLHTTQGVEHWLLASPQLPDGQSIVAVAFISADSARVVTAAGLSCNEDAPPVPMTFTSWATSDGGTLWSRGGSFDVVQDPGLSWQGALDFVNLDDGWFSANQDDTDTSLGTTLFRTVDGGAHWEEIFHLVQSSDSPSGPCFAQATATFISPTTGWLTGGGCASAEFDVTRNGGATWSRQPIPLLSTQYLGLSNPTFINSVDGFMLGLDPTEQPGVLVFVTFDGGRSWTAHAAPGIATDAAHFNGEDGWLLDSDTLNTGYEAGLYVTYDGGRIWNTLQPLDHDRPSPEGFDFNGSILDFVSPSLGWTNTNTGVDDNLLQTTDGGRTWKLVPVQVSGSSG